MTDVVMPSMSGLDLARRARELRPEVRIVLASGYPDGGAAQTPVEGIAAILQKPFTPDMLERAVREALERPK